MDAERLTGIAQGRLEIMNPTTPDKVCAMGRLAGLGEGSRVIEFGSGNGTILALWEEAFGISGTGIELREEACLTAREICGSGINIICADASEFRAEEEYDLAACIGSSHIWGGPAEAIAALTENLKEDGRIILGERYWKRDQVPPEFARAWPEFMTEYELLGTIREAGFELSAVMRADAVDVDAYESGIWENCLDWLRKNPGDEGRWEVLEYLHRIQEEYLAFGREYVGWAMYMLAPAE